MAEIIEKNGLSFQDFWHYTYFLSDKDELIIRLVDCCWAHPKIVSFKSILRDGSLSCCFSECVASVFKNNYVLLTPPNITSDNSSFFGNTNDKIQSYSYFALFFGFYLLKLDAEEWILYSKYSRYFFQYWTPSCRSSFTYSEKLRF